MPPWSVCDFLEKTDLDLATYIFGFASQVCFAKAVDDIDGLLKQQGVRLDAAFPFQMTKNYFPIFVIFRLLRSGASK
jgi:hypothetical protein